MAEWKDNSICWYTGDKEIVVSLTDRKFVGKVTLLMNELGGDLIRNDDGSIYCRLPIECLKLTKKRTRIMSDEQKAAMVARLRAARSKEKE